MRSIPVTWASLEFESLSGYVMDAKWAPHAIELVVHEETQDLVVLVEPYSCVHLLAVLFEEVLATSHHVEVRLEVKV